MNSAHKNKTRFEKHQDWISLSKCNPHLRGKKKDEMELFLSTILESVVSTEMSIITTVSLIKNYISN